jgi:hypothetical protein
MSKAARTERDGAIDCTLTLRMTVTDRELLERLVALRASELTTEGYSPTVASYLRGLIRREAAAKGLLPRPRP